MPQVKETKEETVETHKFGKWEFKKGTYQIYSGRQVMDNNQRRTTDPSDPSFCLMVPKTMVVDLDGPEFINQFPDPKIRFDRLQRARDFLERNGATELTDELMEIRKAKIDKQAALQKELANLEKDEDLLRRKQRKAAAQKIKGIGSL